MSYLRYKEMLLQIARDAIAYGLEHGRAPRIEISGFPEALRETAATFVTLTINGQLRGCIGTLQAYQPLAADVAEHAYAAAFRDPRFPALRANELAQLEIHISVLTPAEPMQFDSEEDLIRQMQPGEDGLILEDLGRKGTFLPSVWESLPTPKDFLQHLKIKAGLPEDYWSDTLKVYRYRTESIG